jgi:phosphoglycolate phosphatase-like HAD superfamily hydrolase
MNRIRAIIYDCDGVLFESRRANLAYYNALRNLTRHDHISVTLPPVLMFLASFWVSSVRRWLLLSLQSWIIGSSFL